MRFFLVVLAGFVLSLSLPAAGRGAAMDTAKDKDSYSLGYQFGENLRKQGVEVDSKVLLKGIQDAVAGRNPAMSREAIRDNLQEIRRRIAQAQDESIRETAAKNLDLSRDFLARNGKKSGVVTLPSGLQYEVLAEGSGRKPKAEDSVVVQYRGTLVDGKEFDSSFRRNGPETLPLDSVIPGWAEALQLMREGAKWRICVPPHLAYGETGMGRDVGPNSALIFEIELLSIDGADS